MLKRLFLFSLFVNLLAAEAAPRPHIVYMMADDLGWGDVGYHGSVIATPYIDQLAERGVQLNQFYVQPVCSPTRGALMTGRYPIRLGLQCGVVRPWASHGLPLDEKTLPEALKSAGYKSAITGKWHLGHSQKAYLPLQRGFDLQYGLYNGAHDYFTHLRDKGHDWHRNGQPAYEVGYATTLIGDEATSIIARHDPTTPLFLYVPFNAPHTPIQAPQSYIDRYHHIKDKNRRTFAAMVTCIDDQVGRIVDALKINGYDLSNTLVVFSSDNGGLLRFGSNGELRGEKSTLYEGGVRVPTVMVWEGQVQAGSMVDEPLHVSDMYPTFLKLAGLSVDQNKPIDGKDAWPTIARGAPTPHEYILHNVNPFCGAIRMGDWKLVHNGHVKANVTEPDPVEQWELFNIRLDTGETQDRKADRPELVAKLKQQLKLLADSAVDPVFPANRLPDEFVVPEVWGH